MLSHFRESGARFGVCEWDGSVRVDGNEQSQRLLEAATLEGVADRAGCADGGQHPLQPNFQNSHTGAYSPSVRGLNRDSRRAVEHVTFRHQPRAGKRPRGSRGG